MDRGRTLTRGAAAQAVGFGVVLALILVAGQALAGEQVTKSHHPPAKRADFARERASSEVRRFADWIVDSADHQGMPFIVVDKTNARVFVFDAAGRIRGGAPALLGLARGDYSVPAVGERESSDTPPQDRTTPAGRFVAGIGMSSRGEDVLWVDYDSGLSLHRVLTTKPEERRLERLATPTVNDNRISYGCINVPKKFYETIVSPAFSGTDGIVYILPEAGSAREMFGTYDVNRPAQWRDTARVSTGASAAQ